jgi:hypothetical protein
MRVFECWECNAREVTGSITITECQACGGDVREVRVVPCPNGVTVSDWRSRNELTRCNDETHEWRSGAHIEEVA